MNYLLLPLDQQFDLGFGSVANSFKYAGDAVMSPQSDSPSLNPHLPASFLYRHAIELFLKSGILIFHRKFELPFGDESFSGEPKVLMRTKWKAMYTVHGIQDLYNYFRTLVSGQASYLSANTRTDWSFPSKLDAWISDIEATDSTSTFFRYPVTKHRNQDGNKSVHKEGNFKSLVAGIGEGSKPLKAFLVVDENDEVVKAFHYDDELAKSMTATLRSAADLLYGYHAAMRWELTGGE
jgi:hypothetical protein